MLLTSTSVGDFAEAKLAEKANGSDLLTPGNDLSEGDIASAASGAPPRANPPPVARPAVVAVEVEVKATPAPAPEPVRETEPTPEPTRYRAPSPEPVRQREVVPEPVRQPEPVKAEPKPTTTSVSSGSHSATKKKTEDEDMLDGLTEEELAQLLEETGLDKVAPSARAEPLKGIDRAVTFVYEDPAVNAEKKSKERADLEELIEKIEKNAYEVPTVVNLNSNE